MFLPPLEMRPSSIEQTPAESRETPLTPHLAVQGTLKSLLQLHSLKASILQCSAFFIVQLSHPYTWVGKIPRRRERLPTPVFWPGEFQGGGPQLLTLYATTESVHGNDRSHMMQ